MDKRYVGLVRHVAAQAARRAELSEERVDDVKLAVTELVSNAIEAHNRAGETSLVRVEIVIDNPFEVRVLDRGEGLDEDALRRSSMVDEGGLGLMITQALVDQLRVEPRQGGGSEITVSMARTDTS